MAISDIDDTIRQVRASIFELGPDTPGVRASALALVRELAPVVGFEIPVTFAGPIDSVVPEQVTEHLLATLREAITNIARHAHATEATVALSVADGLCRLQVTDNGCGLNHERATEGGLGLVNLRRRAEMLHGQLVVESQTGGTRIFWEVPIDRR